MKKIFFTSDTKHYHKNNNLKIANELDNKNGIVNQLNETIDNYDTILFIASDSSDFDKVDEYSKLLFDGLKYSGIIFNNYLVLDDRTMEDAKDFIEKANVIFLSGGDTYIQSMFFKKLCLSEILANYDGVIIGQSAGSINLAKDVYNSPEECEKSEPIYFDGLGLSNINIEPHFSLNDENFDDSEIYQRKHILEESKKRPIYALCDGSHILETEDFIEIYGESYLIEDGKISMLCDDSEHYNISQKKLYNK